MGNIKFEYTARDTPQANCLVELGFNTLYNRARAMLQYANVPKQYKSLVAKDCIKTATLLDSLLTTTINGHKATRWEHYYKRKPKFTPHLRIWGTAGVVKLKTMKTAKLDNRGKVCMLIGYAPNHNVDTYRMFHSKTKTIYTTRDVKWLDRMYFDEDGKVTGDKIDFDMQRNRTGQCNEDKRNKRDKDDYEDSETSDDSSDNSLNDNDTTKARKGSSVSNKDKKHSEIKDIDNLKRFRKQRQYTGDMKIQSHKNKTVTFLDLQEDNEDDEIRASSNNSINRNENQAQSRVASAVSMPQTTTRSGRQVQTPTQFTYRVLGETGTGRSMAERIHNIGNHSQSNSEEAKEIETDQDENSENTEENSIIEDATSDTEQSVEVLNSAFSKAELQLYHVMHEMNDFEVGEIATVAGTTLGTECFRTYSRPINRKSEADTALVGTIGYGFTNTQELIPMKFKAAMKTKDKEEWLKAVDEEYRKFLKYMVFTAVKLNEVPVGAKFLSSTWAMKKKANGTFRARLNMRGYEQEDGEHYDSASIASPVTNDITIRMMLVLMLMAGWTGYLVDVKGAFLHGEFENNEEIYTKIPEGFEKYWDPKVWAWKLTKTIYGMKQAAMCFWREILKAMNYMGFQRGSADPCLYWKYDKKKGYTIWLSWIDDCLGLGPRDNVMESKNEFCKLFDCDDIGEFKEYVGCKLHIDRDNRTMKFTQPVLIQSFEDEFILPKYNYKVPGEPHKVLQKCEEGHALNHKKHALYRKGVGKLLHLMRWSRPEIYNPVRETSRRMSVPNEDHYKAMLRIMKYCTITRDRGWILKPRRNWNGIDQDFEFVIRGKSDSNFATCSDTRKSVTGYCVYMEEALITVKSGMQKIVALSVTEAETIAAVQCVQEMIYCKKVLESLNLKAKLPMVIEIDNKGAVDLINGWSTAGGTKHIDVRLMYLRELKEQGIIRIEWIPTDENESDIFTKNVDISTFEKHRQQFCSES
jgi:hypothetical protein